MRWNQRENLERQHSRTAQSFCVPKSEIASKHYDLSLNRFKEVIQQEVAHRSPRELVASLERIEAEIEFELKELESMLK